jgi:selenocysteine-specific elongation factor
MYVIGTAGHVDHGKSTLIRALTGIDPDRLKEEKEREMTIDLGFAWLDLPSGQNISIVDVPGHEDFIKNMLAGVGGIDAVLLVIAADESVMPQTREHLAILDLLEVKAGVVALTKIDMVQDEEWIELVKMDIEELLQGTSLDGAPIVPVSARSGQGLIDLEDAIDRLLQSTPPRHDLKRPRLPVDRVFTKPGFGTIVTGTLIEGKFEVGQEVEIQPKGLKARVRGLQTHKQKVTVAVPGSRVAVNLSGVGVEDLERGDVLVSRGWLRGSHLIDVQVRVLPDFSMPLKHDMEVEIFSGAAQVIAYARILGAAEIQPGQAGWAQLRLAGPVAVAKGDRFIIRQPSPSRTIGGGTVVDPYPRRRHRRFSQAVIKHLDAMASDTPEDILLATLYKQEPIPARLAVQRSQLDVKDVARALGELLGDQRVFVLNGEWKSLEELAQSSSYLLTGDGLNRFIDRIQQVLTEYHNAYPLRLGMPHEELNSRLGLDRLLTKAIVDLAAGSGEVTVISGTLSLPSHRVTFTVKQQQAIEQVMARLRASPFTPPHASEVEALLGPDVLYALMEQGCITQIREDIFFLTETYQQMVDSVISHLHTRGTITMGETRDMFNASRKYAQALLEHMDERRITQRIGDERVLRQKS